ncbi:MAG: ABC transporter ATP-binding protein [Burkholderiales bacterium]|nr:ABC transporter ATP-binding protein [Burkholderiales bacterium]
MFELQDVSHAYDGAEVLRVDAWQAAQGEHWLLLGPSGSGKTTLLHALAGILRPAAGTVTVAGQDLAALGAQALDRFRGRHIGIVLQRLHLIPSLDVAHNLLLAQYLAGLPQDRRRIDEVLGSLDLAEKATAKPHELSFGQAQRVAIARALVPRPEVLLLDEPFSALDAFTRADLQDHLLALWGDTRPTLILVTHDVDEAIALADRIMVMRPRPGRILEEIASGLPRPRDRRSDEFDAVRRRVLDTLDRSLDRSSATAIRERLSEATYSI